MKSTDFLEGLEDKMQCQINWQQVDEDKKKIYNEIKLFFKQLQTDIA